MTTKTEPDFKNRTGFKQEPAQTGPDDNRNRTGFQKSDQDLDETRCELVIYALQSIFWDDFYTKLALKITTKSLETSKLSGQVEIWLK